MCVCVYMCRMLSEQLYICSQNTAGTIFGQNAGEMNQLANATVIVWHECLEPDAENGVSVYTPRVDGGNYSVYSFCMVHPMMWHAHSYPNTHNSPCNDDNYIELLSSLRIPIHCAVGACDEHTAIQLLEHNVNNIFYCFRFDD